MSADRLRAEEREAELHRRLMEAEETLRAIREGDVDALVVRGALSDEVFPLGGQDSYRAFMEAMEIGAAALDPDGRLVYANSALSSLLGRSAEDLQRDGLFGALGERAAAQVRCLLADPGAGRRTRQIALPRSGGHSQIEVTAAPLSLGFGDGHALTFTDVTERIDAVAANESERIGRAIMASSNETVILCDRNGVVTHANAGVRQFHQGLTVGKRFDEIFSIDFPLGCGLMSGGDLVQTALSGTAVRGIEATLVLDGRRQTLLLSAGPLRQTADAVLGCIVSISDITEQKAGEKRQAFLLRELGHRVKNTLTLVISIANRTISGSKDLTEFRSAFGRRIEALAATHNLLAEGALGGLTLGEIVGAELAPYVTVGGERIALEGMNFRFVPDTAVALGLILHELVTNAVKYGALSNETGRISIEAAQKDGVVEIVWQEDGGPPVEQPAKMGFGQTVITRGLGQTGARATRVDFRREGLVCRMFVPVEQFDLA